MPHHTRRPAALAVLLGLAALAACGETTGLPPDVERLRASYTLRLVDGRPLPASLGTTASTEVQMLAQTLSFDGHGTVRQTWATRHLQRFDAASAPAESFGVSSIDFPYRVRGDTVVIGTACPPGPLVDCLPVQVGVLSGPRRERFDLRPLDGSGVVLTFWR